MQPECFSGFDLFSTLDMLALERTQSGCFVPLGSLNATFESLGVSESWNPDETFPYLNDFLADAGRIWAEGGRIDSDVWVQSDTQGRERALEASAIGVGNRSFLVLRVLGSEYEERKNAVQKARESRLLYERLRETARELAAARDELGRRNREMERLNRLKSEFVASMSHELRTPLNAILGFSSLLAEDRQGTLTPEQSEFVQHVQRGAQHLLKLINDILDLSKIEAGYLKLDYETFPLADSLTEVLSTVRPLAGKKRIRLAIEQDSSCVVHADRRRFVQILLNLLSNAIAFTPDEGSVGIQTGLHGDWLVVEVSDTGVGIPPEEQTAIFDKFHQVGTGTRRVREGTGLGLAVTKALVEAHGGTISVDSAPGSGSRFTFRIPCLRTEDSTGLRVQPMTSEGSTPVSSAPGQSANVVIVEDNPANAALFRAMLQPVYAVRLYGDGEEALAAMVREVPDLVLLDISLPGMDGIEVLRLMRADESLRSIPVVAVSAHAMAGDREKFLSEGFDEYVTKPIASRAALLAVVEPLLTSGAGRAGNNLEGPSKLS
ncbi:MAG: response regulator [Bryobacteraceae bacterium]|nr:response regulator [Bryobacterales bacterium]MEB2362004.1 ATP-binding protein [Bryobacterales bacterium]NUN02437.1 response regulator [Bryobacteraceae bacterium]